MRSMVAFCLPSLTLLLVPVALADGGAAHKTKQTPPIQLGTSGGSVNDRSNFYCCGGTLGALVLRDGVLCILSNNHVLARSGSATAGEDTLQPGLIDSGCNGNASNIVADFSGNLVPLGTANVDAGLSTARLGMVNTTGAILDIGVPCTNTQSPSIGMPVRKSGRTTGHTTGNITSINTSVQIQYQKGCGQGKKFNVVFTNQVVTGAMSAGGDSGSLLVSNDGTPNPVGLLFAGSSAVTVYNPIQHVVNAFTAGGHSFSFVGTPCGGLVIEEENWPVPSAEELADAVRVKVENEAALFQIPLVVGVGVGVLEENPIAPAIVIYVESLRGPLPTLLPSTLDGLPVRVIRTDKLVAQ